MNAWLTDLTVILKTLLGGGTPTDLWLLGVIGVLVSIAMIKIMSAVTGSPNSTYGNCVLGFVLGAALMLAAAVAVRLYLFPDSADPMLRHWAPIAAAAVAFFALQVPILSLLHRVKYLTALVTLVASFAVALLAVAGTRTLLGGVRGGKATVERSQERNKEIEKNSK